MTFILWLLFWRQFWWLLCFGEKDRVETVPPPAAALWRDRFYRRLRARLRVQQWSGDPPQKWPTLQPPNGHSWEKTLQPPKGEKAAFSSPPVIFQDSDSNRSGDSWIQNLIHPNTDSRQSTSDYPTLSQNQPTTGFNQSTNQWSLDSKIMIFRPDQICLSNFFFVAEW